MKPRYLSLLAIPVAAALMVPAASSADPSDQVRPSEPTGAGATQPAAEQTTDTSGIPGVIAYANVKGYHVAGKVNYSTVPAMGGPHNSIWANAGVYTVPIPAERAVHDLEHGAIWITYQPNLSTTDVDALTRFVGRQSTLPEQATPAGQTQRNRFMILSPKSANATTPLPAPIVVTAWAHQLYLDSPTDSRLQQFVNTFRRNKTYSPEFNEPVDNQPVHIAGRPAEFGGTAPNPE